MDLLVSSEASVPAAPINIHKKLYLDLVKHTYGRYQLKKLALKWISSIDKRHSLHQQIVRIKLGSQLLQPKELLQSGTNIFLIIV